MSVDMRCKIVGVDDRYHDVVIVEVPGIYPHGTLLPERFSLLYQPAALALDKAMQEISSEGGQLFISDMFRSAEDQAKAHADYLMGRKSAYSPPSCGSMHESGRAIDIDVGNTVIGLKKTKEILLKHGWIGIANKGKECWHHDWRGEDGQRAYDEAPTGMKKYAAMARYCKEVIGNTASLPEAEEYENKIVKLQKALNKLEEAGLAEDGIYGPKSRAAVIKFQKKHGLVPDGMAGPITWAKIEELLRDT